MMNAVRVLGSNVKPRPMVFLLCAMILGLGVLILALPSCAKDSADSARTHASISKTVFDNGLTLLVKPNPANEVVAVNVFVRMGLMYEPLQKAGLSTLTQRVLTMGTTSRSAQEIANETESVGAHIGASASHDYGNVVLLTTREGFERSMKVFLDVLQNPTFPQEEVEKEKSMLLQQIATMEDQPFNAALIVFLKSFYGDHPYAYLPTGTLETVSALKREDLVDWFRKVYVPNNMVITVVGNVDPAEVSRLFADSLGKLPRGNPLEPARVALSTKAGNIESYKQKNTQALFFVLGYPGPDILNEDAPAMDVLNTILGAGMSSRLFVELRDKKGLAYAVSSGYLRQAGPSCIFAFMATAPANYKAARDGMIAEFEKLMKEEVSPDELMSAKKFVKGIYIMSHETNSAQGSFLGRYEMLGLGYEYDQKYPELIEKVTAADIKRVAKEYFDYFTIGALSPVPLGE
ncbi:MAG: insulinase family protein [Firmicutes bacterium]|nr:insulinase family protein [Bacillota bacterium]